jgi:hypothetical protein
MKRYRVKGDTNGRNNVSGHLVVVGKWKLYTLWQSEKCMILSVSAIKCQITEGEISSEEISCITFFRPFDCEWRLFGVNKTYFAMSGKKTQK